jgi:hypothetical protein
MKAAVLTDSRSVPRFAGGGSLLDTGSQLQTTPRKGSIHTNGATLRSGMLNKIVGGFRAGYPTDAPQFGHAALVALCPATAGVPSAVPVTSFEGDPRA